MSGPVTPPLEVTEVDGSPDGRPITKIVVSNGDLTVSGRTATIDTSGSATAPAGSDTQTQFNDGGAFGASSLFTWVNNLLRLGSSGVSTAGVKSIGGKDMEFTATQTDGSTASSMVVVFGGDTTQDIGLFPLGAEGKVIIGASTSDPGIISARGANQNLGLKVSGTGAVEVENTTSNNDTTFQVAGNGTGKPIINLKNDAMSASLEVTTNQEMTIKGGTDSFKFDVSSATGGITFPDSTTLVSAEGTAILSTGEAGATKFLREDGDGTCSWQAAGGGVTFPLEADAGSVSLPSYSFDGDTNTGMYSGTADTIEFATAGSEKFSIGQDGGITEIMITGDSGNQSQITTDSGTDLFLTTQRGTDSGKITINAGASGDIEILPSIYGTGKSVIHFPQFGTSDPPLTSGATGTAGQLAYDSGYLYICTATDTWERAAVATW